MPNTDSRGWPMPVDGGSAGTWGAELNTLFDDHIEDDVDSIESTANAAMPKAGGVFTGEIEVKTERYNVVDKGTVSGSTSIDLSAADFQVATISGDTTFSFSGWPSSGKVEHVELEIHDGGSATVSWPSAIKWDGGSEPALQTSGVDVVVLYSRDGGTTIRGMHAYSRSD